MEPGNRSKPLWQASAQRVEQLDALIGAALRGEGSLRSSQPHWVIGRREWVRLPLWEGQVVQAKVDTGARSSSLHAEELELFERAGAAWVGFRPVHSAAARVEMPVLALREVISSNGEAERRAFVRVSLQLGPLRFETVLNLTQRDQLRYPMLLGRSVLNGVFLVNPQRTGLAGWPTEG